MTCNGGSDEGLLRLCGSGSSGDAFAASALRSAAEWEVRVTPGEGVVVHVRGTRCVCFGKAVRGGFLLFVGWRTAQQQNLYQRLSRWPMDGEALHEA